LHDPLQEVSSYSLLTKKRPLLQAPSAARLLWYPRIYN